MLSVLIPTLNAAPDLPACLAAVKTVADEVVVADGGSTDGTPAIARACGAGVVAASPGRGGQLMAAAAAARGDWLLALHADTTLAGNWAAAARAFMAAPQGRECAGYFRLRFDDGAAAARRLEAVVAWRCRRLGLPYGDQGLLLSRALYDAVGGFRPLPLMEDVDLGRRLGRRRLVALDGEAVTSAARYRRDGYLARSGRNLACLALYFLGVPPARLRRLYG